MPGVILHPHGLVSGKVAIPEFCCILSYRLRHSGLSVGSPSICVFASLDELFSE